jgi:hypothetical protein
MRTLPCPHCGLQVLELEGQFSKLDSFYIHNGFPPPETSGWWHARCLADSDAAAPWYEARLRSFRNVRRYAQVAEYADWIVLKEPNREKVLALGRSGTILDLSRGNRKLARPVDGGRIYPKVEEAFRLELDDPELVRSIQEQLLSADTSPLLAALSAMGIAEKLVHPEALERSVFRFDKALQLEWAECFVSARVEYGVFIPSVLEQHVGNFAR